MSNPPNWAHPPFEAPDPIPPVHPDFYSCFQLVGPDPVYEACARAAARLDKSPEVRMYNLRDPNQRWALPITYRVGERELGSQYLQRVVNVHT